MLILLVRNPFSCQKLSTTKSHVTKHKDNWLMYSVIIQLPQLAQSQNQEDFH